MKRFVKFTEKLSTTKKQTVRNVYYTMMNDCRSTIGMNARMIRLKCNPAGTKVTLKDIEKQSFCPIPQSEDWRISVIKDLIGIRDNMPSSIGWDKDEILDALDYVCTS